LAVHIRTRCEREDLARSTCASIAARRAAKYNRLLRIEEELGDVAVYPKGDFKLMYKAFVHK
jgi:hypothetical protein